MSAKRHFDEAFGDDSELMVEVPYFSYKLNHDSMAEAPRKLYSGNLLEQYKELFPDIQEEVITHIIKDSSNSIDIVLENLKSKNTFKETKKNSIEIVDIQGQNLSAKNC